MLSRAKSRFPDRLRSGQLDRITAGPVARQIRLADQYRALQKGDVVRRLDLHKQIPHAAGVPHATSFSRLNGGHLDHHPGQHAGGTFYHGRISPHYASHAFRHHYYGHHFFAGIYWYPRWTPWVSWSWHYRCHPIWDPRPVWCRPVIYAAAPAWTWYQPSVWVSLPVVASGTWVDVEPAVVHAKHDLQLLAVRFVDPGHPEEKLGPRYRVWFRNNSDQPITRPFDVMLFAGGEDLAADLPSAGVRVTSIEAGDIQSVDIRLPVDVFAAGRDEKGDPAAFGTLHVLVDANRAVAESSEINNGTRIPRADVLPVDPAAFEVDPIRPAAGGEVLLAGEGFGPQPGKLLVHIDGQELEGEILGWYDLGVRATLPKVALAAATEAELIVIRGDGAAANPLKITISPEVPK